MTEAAELLPCPFCGERDITFNAVFPGYDGAFASCPNCDTASGRYKSEADAVAAWNARALLPALITVREAFKDGISDAMHDAAWDTPESHVSRFLAMLNAAIREAKT